MMREILYSFIRKISREKRLVVAIPYFWLLLFFFVPVLLVLKISFSQTSTQIPPFSHLIDISEKAIVTVRLNIGNYLTILSDHFYIKSFISSLTMALIATIGCLMIGYTMAY
ncbi:MAG: putrescine ABC transporter permease PotH, partial [Proteobacteria bacterium]|nr:putrescine ABC transporter permease PotH [Pseudomonadota bacterium]